MLDFLVFGVANKNDLLAKKEYSISIYRRYWEYLVTLQHRAKNCEKKPVAFHNFRALNTALLSGR
jgi:hypothetical protein